MRERDLKRLRDGLEPSYFVHANGLKYQDVSTDPLTPENYQLYFPVEEVQTTLLRLELEADSVKYIKHVATGKLTELTLTDLGTVNVIEIGATNTDKLTAAFNMRVGDCVNATASSIFQP